MCCRDASHVPPAGAPGTGRRNLTSYTRQGCIAGTGQKVPRPKVAERDSMTSQVQQGRIACIGAVAPRPGGRGPGLCSPLHSLCNPACAAYLTCPVPSEAAAASRRRHAVCIDEHGSAGSDTRNDGTMTRVTAYEVLAMVACAGHLALAFASVVRSARSPLASTLALFCVVMFGWNLSVLLYRLSRATEWYYLDVAISPWTTPVAMHFVLAFVGLRRRLRLVLWVAYSGFGALSLVSAAAFFWPWADLFVRTRLWSMLHLAGVVPVLGWAIWLLVGHLRRQTNAEEKVRTRLVLAALAVGGVLATTELWAGAGVGVPRLGPMATLLIAALLAVVALRYQLFERNLSALAAVDALAVACVALLAYLAVFRFLASSAAALVLSSAILALLLAAVLWRAVTTTLARRAQTQRLALLGRFSGQLAHDLKNPLAALKGATQFLQEERARGRSIDDQEEFLALLGSEIDRLSRLVDKYRRLGSLEPERADTDLNELVTSTLQLKRLGVPPGIHLRTELAPDLPPAFVDADLLAVALENLLRNAVDAMAGEGELLVRTEPAGDAQRPTGVIITVSDTGTGMDARQKERAFDEFFTTKSDGSGLGLSLVRRVVEAHDGEVSLTSRVGTGTRVRLRLPRT